MTATAVEQVWERANESERYGFSLGLFPSWVMDYDLAHEDTVTLMNKSVRD